MERRRKLLATLLLTAFVWVAAGPRLARAFHDGGAGACGGCHIIHATAGASSPGQYLLLKSDPSSVCLNCHSGLGGANIPSVFSPDGSALTPGGDFYWLTKSYAWVGGSSPGYSHGHNVVAADYNLTADPANITAPGGTYPSSQLSCISCHDPHGRVKGGTGSGGVSVSVSGSYGEAAPSGSQTGNYRLLGDTAYTSQGVSFLAPAPVARANGLSPFSESDTSHVDYGSGMSEWCANCHAGILNNQHQSGSSSFTHPSGAGAKLDASMVTRYDTYLRSGDLSGSAATAYLQFVPFERGRTDASLLDPTSTDGPDANSNVMCLTCHRAHASAFRAAGRWDFDVALLVNSHPALGDSGVSASDVAASYYGRSIATEFGNSQGSFCEKCHATTP